MKQILTSILSKLCALSVLFAGATASMGPCFGPLYEEKLPKELEKDFFA